MVRITADYHWAVGVNPNACLSGSLNTGITQTKHNGIADEIFKHDNDVGAN